MVTERLIHGVKNNSEQAKLQGIEEWDEKMSDEREVLKDELMLQ